MIGKVRILSCIHISFTVVPVVEKCTQSGSKELELKDFENLMTHILNEAGEIDLDELISNFIQSRSSVSITS